jgi:hypothetical protein
MLRRVILTTGFLCFFAASSFAGVVGHIVAGYDGGADSSYFDVFNDSGITFTNVVVYGLQEGSLAWETWNLPDIAPGTDSLQYFTNGGGAFAYDYDDSYGGGGDNQYFLTTAEGFVSDVFSPNVNNTGGFLGFLGNDASGAEWDADLSATAANVSAPEPGSLALIGAGVLLLPVLRQKLRR